MECVVNRVCEEEVVEIPKKYKILLYISVPITAFTLSVIYNLLAWEYIEYLRSRVDLVDLTWYIVSLFLAGSIGVLVFLTLKSIICSILIKKKESNNNVGEKE